MNENIDKILQLVGKISLIGILISMVIFLFNIAPYFKPLEIYEKGVLRLVVDDKDVTNSLPDEVYNENGVIMMSKRTVMKFFDNIFIYYDEKYDTVTITSEKMVGKIKLGESSIDVNGEIKELKGSVRYSGDQLYIPISSLQEITGVNIEFNEKVIATTLLGRSRMKIIKVAGKHKLKAYKNEISMINGIIDDGDEMFIFDTENKTKDDYLTIRNNKGDLGYILFGKINCREIVQFNQGYDIHRDKVYDELKFTLVWEYAENYTPDRTNEIKNNAIDIISPTWMYLKNKSGDLKVTTDEDYFYWAKAQKYKVWPTLKNDFTSIEELSVMMNDMKLRDKFIDEVVAYAVDNKFDGVNIDFENMKKEDKDVFSEFVRELSAHLRRNNIVSSIDVTIPGGSDTYSFCYDRKALGKAVDFIMLMAYDEYGSWSNEAGPVASLSWVKRNIEEMIGYEGVDKDKLFLCVPFYSRYWTVNSETGKKISTKAIDMKTANSYLEKYKNDAIWSEEAGQYYIEFTSNGVTTKIWIENEEALREKIELINKYDLAGVAVWRWGYEDEKAWSTIDETMKIQ